MNARRDRKHWYNPTGKQYALGGTIDGWTHLTEPTRRQRRALRLAYSGLHPLLLSKYGYRQWRAVRPTARIVVKDPFAVLSLRAITAVTAATPVIVVRHPGAILVSYRRMGWRPDVDELAPLAQRLIKQPSAYEFLPPPPAADLDSVESMAWFWNFIYSIALGDSRALPNSIIADHGHISSDLAALHNLRQTLGLSAPPDRPKSEVSRRQARRQAADPKALHNFNRESSQVAEEWNDQLTAEERDRIEHYTGPLRRELSRNSVPCHTPPDSD